MDQKKLKIDSQVRSIKEMLDEKKYKVDFFQREYRWGKKHIEQLLIDLNASFMSNYEVGHTAEDIADYNIYYLGPLVLSEKGNIRSIVDGQQRLTSITLLLIYLNNAQADLTEKDDLTKLIYSKKFGRKSYNIEVPDRTEILDALFFNIEKDFSGSLDLSVINMFDRYNDIKGLFPDELKDILSLFIEWLKEKVVFVEIVAYSDENAYTIFETMNDRGLNITPTEMLKGFILTNVKDIDKINELNQLWKERLFIISYFSKQEDSEFFKAWFRGLYADSIRSTLKGAENEDFEKIGTKFHTWVRDNSKKIGLRDAESYYYFVKSDFNFYSEIYFKITTSIYNYNKDFESLYISSFWNIASSLSYPLLLASIDKLDDQKIINEKIKLVSRFLDIYTIIRILNNKTITQTSIRYFIYSLVKDIRRVDLDALMRILKDRIDSMSENLTFVKNFEYSITNRKFIHYLFARLEYYLDCKYVKSGVSFDELIYSRRKNRLTLVPIINSEYVDYKDSFDNEDEFSACINMLGNYIIIPNSSAPKFIKSNKIDKLKNLKKENFLSASLYNDYNDNQKYPVLSQISNKYGIEPITEFSIESIRMRTEALFNIIREVWSFD